jgi:hypothetical protein
LQIGTGKRTIKNLRTASVLILIARGPRCRRRLTTLATGYHDTAVEIMMNSTQDLVEEHERNPNLPRYCFECQGTKR